MPGEEVIFRMNNNKHGRAHRNFFSGPQVALAALCLLALVVCIPSCYQASESGPEVASSGPTPTPPPFASADAKTKPAPGDSSGTSAAPPSSSGLKSDVLPEAVMSVELQSLDGKSFRLTDYKGKLVVLDIWATWCGPCRHMIPHLVELQKKYGATGLEVIGLTSEDPETDKAKVLAFGREFGINYKLGWASDEFILSLLGPRYSIPQTFLIGRDGRLYYHVAGYSPQVPVMLEQMIGRLEKGE